MRYTRELPSFTPGYVHQAETNTQRRIGQYIEVLADGIIEVLKPIFSAEQTKNFNVEAVVIQLGHALDQKHLASVFVQANLEPKAVLRAVQQNHPIKDKGLSAAEMELYEMSLRLIVPCLVEVANELPGFEVAHAQATLTGLAVLSVQVDDLLAKVEPIAEIADEMSYLASPLLPALCDIHGS